jgi:hypothetical protein
MADPVNQTHDMPPNASVAPSQPQGGNPKNAPRNERMVAGKSPYDMTKLRSLGARLTAKFTEYRSHRQLVEMKWERNLRQFLGEYDPDVKKYLDAGRSQAYPRLTRVKCVSMLSRIMNLLFPTTEKNWGIAPSPVPNLEASDLVQVLEQAMQAAQQAGKPLSDEVIETAIRAFAKVRSDNLEREIADQLAEIGGSRKLDYVALCRKVLQSGIIYGMGVIKGPFVRQQKVRTWERNAQTGVYEPKEYVANRPQFEFVPVWDYYPDLTAKYLHQMDGQFHRMVLSKAQLRELADRPDFFGEEIKDYLAAQSEGQLEGAAPRDVAAHDGHAAERQRALGPQVRSHRVERLRGTQDLTECGIELPDTALPDMVDASCGCSTAASSRRSVAVGRVGARRARADVPPSSCSRRTTPRSSATGCPTSCATRRWGSPRRRAWLLDNAASTCGPNLEVNKELLRTRIRTTRSITPYKIWYRNGTGAGSTDPCGARDQVRLAHRAS